MHVCIHVISPRLLRIYHCCTLEWLPLTSTVLDCTLYYTSPQICNFCKCDVLSAWSLCFNSLRIYSVSLLFTSGITFPTSHHAKQRNRLMTVLLMIFMNNFDWFLWWLLGKYNFKALGCRSGVTWDFTFSTFSYLKWHSTVYVLYLVRGVWSFCDFLFKLRSDRNNPIRDSNCSSWQTGNDQVFVYSSPPTLWKSIDWQNEPALPVIHADLIYMS